MNSLNEVIDFLSQVPSINAGGCGISALAIYRWLDKNNKLNDDTKFAFLCTSWNEDEHNNNATVIYGNYRNNSLSNLLYVPSHVCLKHNNMYVDSNGYSRKNFRYTYELEVSLNELMEIINNPHPKSGWNKSFDRENVKYIQHNLEIDLGDVNF